MREFSTILGSCRVSRTAQSFFESELVDADLSCSALLLRLYMRSRWILDSLWQHVRSTTKEAELVVKMALSLLRC